MKKILLHVAATMPLFAFVGADCAQETPQHAPTAQTCRADVSLWYSDEIHLEYKKAQLAWLGDKVPNRTDIARLPLTEVDARTVELLECVQVDADYGQHDRYYEAATFYEGVSADRYYRFIVRHNLLQQLRREDEQGLR
jgi:hypothetical protein